MSDDVKENLVGYLFPDQVDLLRTEIANDGNGTLGILDQLVFQAPDGTLLKRDVFINACVQAGIASAAAVVTSAVATTIGGIVLPIIGTIVAAPAAIAGAVTSVLAGAKKVSVTFVVVNTTDQPIEMVEAPYHDYGKLASAPVVRDATNKLPPPNRPDGDTSTNWIDSATAKGLPAGSGAVGVWRLEEDRILGISFVGLGGAIRLKNVDAGYHLYIGAESGYRSLFTSDEKNAVAAKFEQGSYSGSAQDFFDKHVTGQAYITGGQTDTLSSNSNIQVQVAGNGAKPTALVVTAIIS